MQTVWFCLLAFIAAMYGILDGHDLRVGILYPFVGRAPEERETVRRTILPVWDGNEVWLIAGGAILFFAFPTASGLRKSAADNQLAASQFTAIGAFKSALLGYFSFEKRDYQRILISEQVEVLSLVGDVTLTPDGQPQIHAHVVLGKSDGTAHGGHLIEAHVRPTLEVVLTESPVRARPRDGVGADPGRGNDLMPLGGG